MDEQQQRLERIERLLNDYSSNPSTLEVDGWWTHWPITDDSAMADMRYLLNEVARLAAENARREERIAQLEAENATLRDMAEVDNTPDERPYTELALERTCNAMPGYQVEIHRSWWHDLFPDTFVIAFEVSRDGTQIYQQIRYPRQLVELRMVPTAEPSTVLINRWKNVHEAE